MQHLAAGAAVQGVGPEPLDTVTGLAQLLLANPNTTPGRDSLQGFYQIPLIAEAGKRVSVREFIADTVNEGYPLTVQTNTHVTKVIFSTNSSTPRATGVEFLAGKHLYRASPLSGASGTPGSAKARKEVIISGGSYNTIQILKLSGVGPADELASFGIPLVKDVPALGTNMQDRYEINLNVAHERNGTILDGCTFDASPEDECYTQWMDNPSVLGLKGAYASNGLAATMAVNSDYADTSDIDLYIFGGPVNFTGYFPGWADNATREHNVFSWYTLKVIQHDVPVQRIPVTDVPPRRTLATMQAQ